MMGIKWRIILLYGVLKMSVDGEKGSYEKEWDI